MIRETQEHSSAIDSSLDDQQLLQAVLAFYHERLKQHATAQDYLRKCGLADVELIDRFGLGFADRSLTKLLPSNQVKAGRQLRERLTRLGILRESGHGHFNGCVVVPIRDAQGAIIDIRGRKITKGLRKGTPLDMRLPGTNGDAIEDETVARIVRQLAGNVNGKEVAEASCRRIPTAGPTAAGSHSHEGEPSNDDLDVEQSDNEVVVTFADRRWRIRGLEKNLSYERLKVNLMVSRKDGVHVDTFDLYSSRHRAGFLKAAAAELYVEEELIKKDLAKLLRKLEELQDERIKATLTPTEAKTPELTDAQRREAFGLLKDRNLLGRIVNDFDRYGLVGEETNKLLCYLACVSRKLAQPLAILIQSSSAAGKTTLMDAALALVPAEEQIKYSAMTGQSLYYMGQTNLKHKILAIAEEEGVAQASYALKLLQSEGKLTIASAEKETNGRQQTQTYEVEGPIMIFLTTTSEYPDPELQNRCFLLRVDEQVEQTAAIHARQRAAFTLDGRQAELDRTAIRALHQNAQRLLEPITVVIPFADQLTFRADQTRMRRDHAKYLSLIASITLLYQHQRPRKTDTHGAPYIEATLDDIELANRLASEALGQSLDSLMPQTRQLLVLIDDYLTRCCREQQVKRSEFRFTQRQLREAFTWSDGQLRRNLQRLIDLEYVLPYRTGHGNGREYELLYDGQGRDGQPFVLGLIDTSKLSKRQYHNRNGALAKRNGAQSAPSRRADVGQSARSKNGASANGKKQLRSGSDSKSKNEPQAPQKNGPS